MALTQITKLKGSSRKALDAQAADVTASCSMEIQKACVASRNTKVNGERNGGLLSAVSHDLNSQRWWCLPAIDDVDVDGKVRVDQTQLVFELLLHALHLQV